MHPYACACAVQSFSQVTVGSGHLGSARRADGNGVLKTEKEKEQAKHSGQNHGLRHPGQADNPVKLAQQSLVLKVCQKYWPPKPSNPRLKNINRIAWKECPTDWDDFVTKKHQVSMRQVVT